MFHNESGVYGKAHVEHAPFMWRSRGVRLAGIFALLVGGAISGCRERAADVAPPRASTAPGPVAQKPPPKVSPAPDADALPPASGLPAERRAIQVVAGEERVVDVEEAR